MLSHITSILSTVAEIGLFFAAAAALALGAIGLR
jgi:hypothetical protein